MWKGARGKSRASEGALHGMQKLKGLRVEGFRDCVSVL